MEQVGEPDPDQDVQFEFIHSETDKSLQDGIPVIFVDTKKKESVSQHSFHFTTAHLPTYKRHSLYSTIFTLLVSALPYPSHTPCHRAG
ncbi:MAG: hypothetical protein K2N34_05055 [Lachnospiraceae bacterium]|nr:hypothetical protein [Lachnospiraceae bacterium]